MLNKWIVEIFLRLILYVFYMFSTRYVPVESHEEHMLRSRQSQIDPCCEAEWCGGFQVDLMFSSFEGAQLFTFRKKTKDLTVLLSSVALLGLLVEHRL